MQPLNSKVSVLTILFAWVGILAVWLLLDFAFPKSSISAESNSSTSSLSDTIALKSQSVDSTLFTIDTAAFTQELIPIDSTDSSIPQPTPKPHKKAVYAEIPTYKKYENLYGGLIHFKQQLAELQQTKTKKVRIAYFGDSMIEGDLITQNLREYYQQTYGGMGVGYMPITSITNRFRYSIHHDFSTNWQFQHIILSLKKNDFPQNWNGEQFRILPGDSAWVRYKKSNAFNGVKQLPNPRLFFGWTQNQAVLIQDSVRTTLQTDSFQLKAIDLIGTSEQVEFAILNHDTTDFLAYGVDFSADTGVSLDNLSSRGNSGAVFTKIPQQSLAFYNQEFQPNLVVLHFGVNVAQTGATDFNWYVYRMRKSIQHLKQAMPQAEFLLISIADKAQLFEGELQTDPVVYAVLQAQYAIAQEEEIAFFNLFEAMGGPNSMVKWATKLNPPLANPDYTHFNGKGARVIATHIQQFLENIPSD